MAKKSGQQDDPPQQPDPHRFEFKLDKAIRDQVLETLEASPMLPLQRNVAPQESGIYALFWKKKLVYIGKASKATTKSKRTLRARLNEHSGKLANRDNLEISDMASKFLTIESDWFVWAAEFALINHFQPEWNGSGYGSKTPGKGRPGTHRVSKWNQMFPLKPGMDDSDEVDDDVGGDDPS
ncbi:MAG: Eco29kI family restriction endonuclease [Planctomycetes bacterium]|nr:Eco29kI family restriction endonuclease [Planctomycetota bacterium]